MQIFRSMTAVPPYGSICRCALGVPILLNVTQVHALFRLANLSSLLLLFSLVSSLDSNPQLWSISISTCAVPVLSLMVLRGYQDNTVDTQLLKYTII